MPERVQKWVEAFEAHKKAIAAVTAILAVIFGAGKWYIVREIGNGLAPLTSDRTANDYLRMVEGKTSRLFALPMGGAALLCGASEEVERGLVEAACHMGVLFQIQDDILDIYGDKRREMAGNDIREGKRSVLVVHCLESVSATDAAWLKQVLDKPRSRTTTQDIHRVRAMFESADSLAFALNELTRRRDAALHVPALAAYPSLHQVLDEACRLFLQPVAAMVPASAWRSPL